MAAGKKAKAKDKGKAATKKVKKGKSPEVTETQTTTTTPAPGSPELTAQEPEQVKEPPVDTSEVKTPLPVSAYEVFDDDTTQDNSKPVADQAPVLDNPVSAYQVFDDDTIPQHSAKPVADQVPVLDNPVSAYQVFDDETTPQEDSSRPVADQAPALDNLVSSYEVLDNDTTPQDGSKPVADQAPVLDNPVSAYQVFDDETTPQDSSEPVANQAPPVIDNPVPAHEILDDNTVFAPQGVPDSVADSKSPVLETPLSPDKVFDEVPPHKDSSDPVVDQSPPIVDRIVDEAPHLDAPHLDALQLDAPHSDTPHLDESSSTQPPIEDSETRESPVEEASLIQAPIEDQEPKRDLEDHTKQDQPNQVERPGEATVVSAAPVDPFSPVAACVPLPSPSLTEARYMSSPSQEHQHYYPGPYSPYASPVPYPAQAPYTSPNAYAAQPGYASPTGYASPVPYAASPVPYTSPNAYSSQVPYASPALYAPVPYAGSPVPYTSSTPYAGSPVPYASSVAYTSSPVPKVSSPLARSHYPQMSPNISPTATPPPQNLPAAPMAPPEAAPSIAQSGPHSLQSPVMSSAGMIPPYGYYSPHHQSEPHYMSRGYSIPDPSYQASYQALHNLSMANGHAYENGSPPENDTEHIELLQRIQSAIPDINRLLHGFRNTHSKLSNREAEMKHIGTQHEQALIHKEYYIEALQAQMKKAANESAEEGAKLKHTISELRLELGDLQEKQKDLEDGLAVHQKSNEELTETKVLLEGQINQLNESIKESKEAHEKDLVIKKEEQEKALGAQKAELTELFEEIKTEDEKTAAENLETRERELRAEHESSRGEWEKEKTQLQESFEAQRTELEATKTEVTSQIAALESKETELQARLTELTTTREELAAKLAELEETHQKNARETEELRQGHAGEIDSLRQSHDEQLAAAAKELADKIAALEAHLNEKEQLWTAERTALEQKLSERDSELASAEREKERLEGDGIVKEQHLQRAVDGMRMTIDNLGGDCDRLRKTLSSLGEATDLRNTKGDQFFLDCFTELSQLIHNLSKEHFGYLPIDPPKDILSKIPSELPPFLDNTPASRELRCAYIQHIISKTLTFRVFQPFLFTLGRRYDKADTFFQMLSMDIRRKSVRREAFWRQQTLKAAYTTSDAKQSINVAAAVIVDEIIDHIKHFADPKHLDSLLIGVRKIVKLAAETWRHARVERELVLANFPAPDAESISNEGWLEYAANKDQSPIPTNEPTRHVVLRIFPRITREAAHEDFATDEEKATGCTYSQGVVLYSDSPVIMDRLQEFAKKSTDALITESPPKTPLAVKAIDRLAQTEASSPKVMTVRSAPTSPKGQFRSL
ncbi:uncharacterized protein N7500_000733 [Penicillium coprophilum]|uniref:uncharacterized protein n=1 Tax=Penicillium coprophilum TaxID=36646 RepID=UPI002381E8CE|nr:uncharacterized protein N7500_000733 [Penicillium coprophilum]KAJ5178034.1 hypothetical protein N7500_000733 [Penicillium coprophilum]